MATKNIQLKDGNGNHLMPRTNADVVLLGDDCLTGKLKSIEGEAYAYAPDFSFVRGVFVDSSGVYDDETITSKSNSPFFYIGGLEIPSTYRGGTIRWLSSTNASNANAYNIISFYDSNGDYISGHNVRLGRDLTITLAIPEDAETFAIEVRNTTIATFNPNPPTDQAVIDAAKAVLQPYVSFELGLPSSSVNLETVSQLSKDYYGGTKYREDFWTLNVNATWKEDYGIRLSQLNMNPSGVLIRGMYATTCYPHIIKIPSGVTKVRLDRMMGGANTPTACYAFLKNIPEEVLTNLDVDSDLSSYFISGVFDQFFTGKPLWNFGIVDIPENAVYLWANFNTAVGTNNFPDVRFLFPYNDEGTYNKFGDDEKLMLDDNQAFIYGGSSKKPVDITKQFSETYGTEYGYITRGMIRISAYGSPGSVILYNTNRQLHCIKIDGETTIRVRHLKPDTTNGSMCYAAYSAWVDKADMPQSSGASYDTSQIFLSQYSQRQIATSPGTDDYIEEIVFTLPSEVKMFCVMLNQFTGLGTIEVYKEMSYSGISNKYIISGDSLAGNIANALMLKLPYTTNVSSGSETMQASIGKNGTCGVYVMPFTIPASGAVQCQWASSLWWKPTIEDDGSISVSLTQQQINECFFVGMMPSGQTDPAKLTGGVRCCINGVYGRLVSIGGYSVDGNGNLVIDANASTTGWFVREEAGDEVEVTAPTFVHSMGRAATGSTVVEALKDNSIHIMWTGQNGGYYFYDENLNFTNDRTFSDHEEEYNAYFDTEVCFLEQSFRAAHGKMIIIGNQHQTDYAHDIFRLAGRQRYTAMCRRKFGNCFIDPMEVFQRLMLEVGHTPTANEKACFKFGLHPDFVAADSSSAGSWTPSSSTGYPHTSNVHINLLGVYAIVNEVLRRLWSLGWLNEVPELYDVQATYDSMVDSGDIIVGT